MGENNDNKKLLRQSLDAINEQEERKKADKIVRLSRLNITIAVLLSLLIPLAGYCYTRRWKALLWLGLSLGVTGAIIGLSSSTEEEAMERGFAIGSIASLIAPIDNSLAISRAKKQIEDINN
ncbi:MAG: hypothetical protein VKL60_16545 [Sphaerospermopsis sp.]|uniref:hypothetical protein n=1 Tax=Sphaerospermopsis sp. LEGE 00249 TaxID=1380707 RepID=UPI00164DD73D|nr:hypothetical protein [Sphaerospermopsis sp. LEGE 00249]MBC5794802.1 hypothetical protein [Sphaerospermopsis sp. LEGE 00249]MEB3150608.1 hypothetical protein [Sphaerospermopsis sp.]